MSMGRNKDILGVGYLPTPRALFVYCSQVSNNDDLPRVVKLFFFCSTPALALTFQEILAPAPVWDPTKVGKIIKPEVKYYYKKLHSI